MLLQRISFQKYVIIEVINSMTFNIIMRTTIVLRDDLAKTLRSLTSPRGLSAFINECIDEHLLRDQREQKMRELEQNYSRAAAKKGKNDFVSTELEGWPEW